MYKCPNCGHASEQAGDCPTCNVPMQESVEASKEEAVSQTPESEKPSE